MARLIESGKIEEVVFARFEPGEDILKALYDICREKISGPALFWRVAEARLILHISISQSTRNYVPQMYPSGPCMEKCEISLQGHHWHYGV